MAIEVALYEPLIPQNTGNIGRLCTGFKVHLHLIEPLGFDIEDNSLKRAGLDYWKHLSWSRHKNFASFYQTVVKQSVARRPLVCFTKFAKKQIQNVKIDPNSILLFGKETTGIPDALISGYEMLRVSIPILGEIRAYNLANSVSIGLFESMRQNHLS